MLVLRAIMGDIFFDNIFTDMAFHGERVYLKVTGQMADLIIVPDRVKESIAQIVFASERVSFFLSCLIGFRAYFSCQLTVERDMALNRTEFAGSEVLVTAEDLGNRRQELDDFRRTTFESYVAQHPPPPNYDVAVLPAPTVNNPLPVGDGSATAEDEIDQFFQSLATTSVITAQEPSHLQMPTPETTISSPPSTWGSSKLHVVLYTDIDVQIYPGNPFAFAISEETRKLSIS